MAIEKRRKCETCDKMRPCGDEYLHLVQYGSVLKIQAELFTIIERRPDLLIELIKILESRFADFDRAELFLATLVVKSWRVYEDELMKARQIFESNKPAIRGQIEDLVRRLIPEDEIRKSVANRMRMFEEKESDDDDENVRFDNRKLLH